MIDIDDLSEEQFNRLPLVIRGLSKEVRYVGPGDDGMPRVVIRFLPTVYSHTANRTGVVEGSDTARLRVTGQFLRVFKDVGVDHAYERVNDRWVLSRLVMPHPAEFARYRQDPFVLRDVPEDVARLVPTAPPVEVIVKDFHGGTSKHGYVGMSGTRVRQGHPLYAGFRVDAEGAYPATVVRFDWRNPIAVCSACGAPWPDEDVASCACGREGAERRRVEDRAMPEDIADLYIDAARARQTALRARAAIQDHLGRRDVVVHDLCLFISQDGRTVYGEVSPDCGRFRHMVHGSLDKNVWRAGGSSDEVLAKWQMLADIAAGPPRDGASLAATCALHGADGRGVELTVGTTNPYKVSEIGRIFSPTGATLVPFGDDAPDEVGDSFAANARLKAITYARATGRVTVADDSGLSVFALGGLPGVHSARFDACRVDWNERRVTGYEPDGRSRDAMDEANNRLVLARMEAVEPANRAAWFTVALAVAAPDGSILFETSSVVDGTVAEEPVGEHGFGYDSIFVPNDTLGLTWAQLDASRKAIRSARGAALATLAVWYGNWLAAGAPGAATSEPAVELTTGWRVVVDGNDGTGKSTLVRGLRALGYDAVDRGLPTKMSDGAVDEPADNEVFLILDVPVAWSRSRLAAAGKSLDEQYHTEESLAHYRDAFIDVAQRLPRCVVIDARRTAPKVLADAVGTLRSLGVAPERDLPLSPADDGAVGAEQREALKPDNVDGIASMLADFDGPDGPASDAQKAVTFGLDAALRDTEAARAVVDGSASRVEMPEFDDLMKELPPEDAAPGPTTLRPGAPAQDAPPSDVVTIGVQVDGKTVGTVDVAADAPEEAAVAAALADSTVAHRVGDAAVTVAEYKPGRILRLAVLSAEAEGASDASASDPPAANDEALVREQEAALSDPVNALTFLTHAYDLEMADQDPAVHPPRPADVLEVTHASVGVSTLLRARVRCDDGQERVAEAQVLSWEENGAPMTEADFKYL